MELKSLPPGNVVRAVILLIVPYGIEISFCTARFITRLTFNRTLWNWNIREKVCLHRWWDLLIVPYGIEIPQEPYMTFSRILLIVPYGIEIGDNESKRPQIIQLLIVPYGIEIKENSISERLNVSSFNRTLWNWNVL